MGRRRPAIAPTWDELSRSSTAVLEKSSKQSWRELVVCCAGTRAGVCWTREEEGRDESRPGRQECPRHASRAVYKTVVLAVQEGIEGTVNIGCVLRKDGTVSSPVTVDGTRVLAEAAAANALKWTFPTSRNRPYLPLRTERKCGKEFVRRVYL